MGFCNRELNEPEKKIPQRRDCSTQKRIRRGKRGGGRHLEGGRGTLVKGVRGSPNRAAIARVVYHEVLLKAMLSTLFLADVCSEEEAGKRGLCSAMTGSLTQDRLFIRLQTRWTKSRDTAARKHDGLAETTCSGKLCLLSSPFSSPIK